jgi:orotidine-5'-phosphate decarboxylase
MEQLVQTLASLAYANGLDGVVCSPKEIAAVRKVVQREEFKIVTPGIRPADAPVGDQKRVMTPQEAIDLGASYLVIGRPITAAPDPVASAEKILNDTRWG